MKNWSNRNGFWVCAAFAALVMQGAPARAQGPSPESTRSALSPRTPVH